MSNELKIICEQAMSEGQAIDFSDCIYGEPHWKGEFINKPVNYYFFLAGLVRFQRLTYILDLGTPFGGSIMSMSKGLYKEDASKSRLVTVDTTYKNSEGFKKYPQIKIIKGDILNKGIAEKIVESFDRNIDLLFIDSNHNYGHVKAILSIYGKRLHPKYVVLDDILLNNSMRRLWNELVRKIKHNVFDATEKVKRENVGIGILALHQVPEAIYVCQKFWLKAYLAKMRIYRLITSITPESLKQQIRKALWGCQQ